MAEGEKPATKVVLDKAAEQRFDIIIRRLQEILGGDTIRAILAEGRSPKCYFGEVYIEALDGIFTLVFLQELRQLGDVGVL